MAQNTEQARRTKVQDFNRIDGVIKEQIAKEKYTREHFHEKYSILFDFDKICYEIAKEEGIDAATFRRMAERCCTRRKRHQPAADDWILPSSGPMPRTTTGEVGWRSANPASNLEIFGPLYRSPKETMEPVHRYTNIIFLG